MIDASPFVNALDGKPVAVFGLGVSGRATLRALEAAGAKVYIADDKPQAGLETQIFDEALLAQCAYLILSPGVPLHYPAPHPVVEAARAAGTKIICDIELFGRCNPGRTVIGITGTNGKSTTAALMHHVLEVCGVPVQLGGNIGKAVMDLDMVPEGGVFVLELSSFQLDLCPSFSPDISVLLNVTPDHLERYAGMEGYAASKAHIFEGYGEAVIAVDDGYTKRIAGDVEAKGARHVHRVSYKEIEFETPALKGAHNRQNIAAVIRVAQLMGLDERDVRLAVNSFSGLAHRQYPVRVIGDVTYINDSKATNAEAAGKALGAFEDIYWIAGGQAKEGGLNGLESLMSRVRHAFLIGEAADEFAAWLEGQDVAFTKCGTLDKAVKAASEMAGSGTVLLSPACASYDQFANFAERGDRFAELVNALPGKASS